MHHIFFIYSSVDGTLDCFCILAIVNNAAIKAKGKQKRKDISTRMQSSKEQQGETRKPSSVISAKK